MCNNCLKTNFPCLAKSFCRLVVIPWTHPGQEFTLINFFTKGCNENVKREAIDLGFVIDGSASLLVTGFRRQLQFITSIVDRLGPLGEANGAENLRVGVVVYGNNAAIRIFLDDYQSDSSFKRALNTLEFRGTSESRIDQGFEKAKQMFEIKNGARPSTRKVFR